MSDCINKESTIITTPYSLLPTPYSLLPTPHLTRVGFLQLGRVRNSETARSVEGGRKQLTKSQGLIIE